MYDIIIIGAGPAGLTAALYARRANKKTLVIESSTYGGQILTTPTIDNFPTAENISGYDFATKLYNQAKTVGAEFIFEKVTKIIDGSTKKVLTTENTYETKSIIIASGSENRTLNLPSEADLIGKGISYCATCDGAFFKDKIVAVVGGGNSAFKEALYLSSIAKKVYLIHRRAEFTAESIMLENLKTKNNIEFITNATITKLNSHDGKLSSINLSTNQTLSLDGLFVAIGKVPATQIFANLINLDNQGYIIASENCHTNVDGIFAAGDIRTKSVRQLTTATADGAIAATEAVKYLAKILQ